MVHSGAAITPTPPEGNPETGYDDPDDVTPVPKGKGRNKSAETSGAVLQLNHFDAYPNPFSERVRFEFVPAGDVRAQIKIFDITGRLVKTVFDQPVKAGVFYDAEFKPGEAANSIYIYRMTMGECIHTGKLIYQK